MGVGWGVCKGREAFKLIEMYHTEWRNWSPVSATWHVMSDRSSVCLLNHLLYFQNQRRKSSGTWPCILAAAQTCRTTSTGKNLRRWRTVEFSPLTMWHFLENLICQRSEVTCLIWCFYECLATFVWSTVSLSYVMRVFHVLLTNIHSLSYLMWMFYVLLTNIHP